MEIEAKPSVAQSAVNDRKSLRLRVIEVTRHGSSRLDVDAKDIEQRSSQRTNQKQENGTTTVSMIKVTIEGVWAQSRIFKNSIIHLVNPVYDKDKSLYTVNNGNGLLVVEPDDLLTCTLVASTLFCERKTWLNNVFLGQVGTNRAMLVGTLVHEVFQHGVRNRITDLTRLTAHLDELLDDATVMLEIYSVELHINDVRNEAISYLSSVKEWIEKFMLAGPRQPLTNESNIEVKVIGISDIEENVWSTKYGLKGKIDVTGSVRVYDKRNGTLVDKTLPLELKTGNPNLSASHAAQVSLYSMMIEDRYAETNQGLVIYLKNKAAMHHVALTHNVKRDLVHRRNQINYHLKNSYFGPEMIDQTRMCQNCERLTECILMSKVYTPGDLDNYPSMKKLVNEATGHLDEKFIQFFKGYHEKLASLLNKKDLPTNDNADENSSGSKGSFWTLSSEEAESKGSGFGKLQADTSKADKGLIVFRRNPDCPTNLINSGDGDHKNSVLAMKPPAKKQKIDDFFKPKRLDDNKPKTKPFDTNLNFSRCRIAISQDTEISSLDSQNSTTAVAIGFMQELKEDQFTLKLYEGAADTIRSDVLYRVDKIEKKTNLDIERLVLVRLLTREDWRCDRIRQLILDPKYEPSENIDLNLFVLSANFEEISELDADHQKAVVEAISTDNYYIFNEKNMGSKSKINRVVSVACHVACSLDRTVLVVAQNIDNLMDLMRILQKRSIKFILIDDGKSTKARYQFAGNLVKVPQCDNVDLVKKYETYIRQHELAPIVITTYAMSIGGLLFTRRTFDYCVAYNCDTTELLVSLSPMFCSDRHIIIDVNEKDIDTPTRQNDVNEDVTLGYHLRTLRPTRIS